MARSGRSGGGCAGCGAPLGRGQRYCVECGARSGPRSAQLLALLTGLRERSRLAPRGTETRRPAASDAASPHAGRGATLASPATAAVARIAALKLPSPRVSALLVLAFAGFGVLIGSAASSRVDDTLAASAQRPLKLVLPPTSPASSGAEAPSATSQAPASEAEATPEASATVEPSTPAPAASTPAPTPKATPKPAGGDEGAGGGEAGGGAKLPAIKHVFVVMLSDQPYAATFGPESAAPYLAQTLEHEGELLVRYYAVAHQQLADGVALLSGQGPTPATAANCPTYEAVTPASSAADGQFIGEGCAYPQTTPTLLGQLEVKRLSWRAYVQGIDEPGTTAPACAHPALGAADPSSAAPPAVPVYATFRNPIVYFAGLTESPSCASDDVGLSSLTADLADPARTPSFAYVVPDRCHDGSPGPCPTGGAGGLAAADGFLQEVVPKILASKAYKESGLLVITTDQAPSTGEFADSSSCCGQPRFPNLPAPTGVAASLPPEGGGQVGALLLSPFVKPHTTSQEPYNHFSLLRTIEDLFKLKHLGYAGGAHVESFEPALFTTRQTKAAKGGK